MARTAVKKRTPQKKRNTGKIIGITVGVAGAAWLGYEFLIKPRQKAKAAAKKAAENAAAAAASAAANAGSPITALIDKADAAPTNKPAGLSPIGTPADKIDWGAKVKYGDKGGEVQVIQKLFNLIADQLGSKKISVDGVYGNETLKKKRGNFGSVYSITPKMVYDKYKSIVTSKMIKDEMIDSLPSWMK